MKVSSLAAPKVVILTTFGAASDEDFIKMKTFSFQCSTDRIITVLDSIYLTSKQLAHSASGNKRLTKFACLLYQ